MYSAHVNNKVFEIASSADGFTINGEPVAWDLAQIQEGYFHILYHDKSYRAEIVEANQDAKSFIIKINGTSYPVILKDRFDLLLEKMGMNPNAGARVNHVRAPMPGLIIDLKVKDGDAVKAGEPLLILEAMKMENIIKAPADAVVKSVKVNLRQGVEKNQVLVEF
jgi:biotin carboxyl carrier protein